MFGNNMANEMFPQLLFPQILMIRYFHLLHGCLLERANLSLTFKRSKRIQSFRSLLIFCKTQTSLEHSQPRLLFQLSIFNNKGEEYDVEQAIQMSLESFQAQGQAHVGDVAIQEPVAEATRPFSVVEGKGKAIATEEQAA
ncbi:hypothetical protein Tco_1082225 [Tanacetum coccineum]|uniref:Uncharacterized protein n=1 Tax=Tanacetum coccineum TaxID=301880 RepID=A0ABQ5I036_9ASTR